VSATTIARVAFVAPQATTADQRAAPQLMGASAHSSTHLNLASMESILSSMEEIC